MVAISDSNYQAHLAAVLAQYQKATQAAGKDACLISSGSLKTAFLDDRTYPFMVNPHFKALLPVTDVADSFILLKGDDKPVLLYHQPQDYWHKVPEEPSGEWVEHWQIEPIAQLQDAHNHLGDVSRLAFIGEETEIANTWGIDTVNQSAMLDQLHHGRSYKTEYEIECLRRANELAVPGHLAAETAFRAGASEFEIQTAYLTAIGHREQQTPYSGIVALNEHAAILHYQHYEQIHHSEQNRHTLLIDAGANYHGYASDITRTFAYRDGVFADLLSAMDDAQLGIIADIELGMNYTSLNEKMHHRLAGILKQFDIIKMSEAQMVEANITFNFMPHGLGHFLGLQTHDVAGFRETPDANFKQAPDKYPALRLTRPIENNQVFTIEPGLYFIPMLLKQLEASEHSSQVNWDLIAQLQVYGGVRIEDNVAMINGKAVNLTREAFNA